MNLDVVKFCLDTEARVIHPDAFVAQNAVVIGDVHVAAKASIWFSSVIRGDIEKIRIGTGTNIQDGTVLHADPGHPCVIGDYVTVGHRCMIHGAKIGAAVGLGAGAKILEIGMNASILNGAVIGEECIIGAGALIPEGKVIEPGSLVVGVPGKIRRTITEIERQRLKLQAEHYVLSAAHYKEHGYDREIP